MSDVLARLKDGNLRYIERINNPSRYKACNIRVGATPQEPFATILSCSDSRVPIVTLFDQGIGDLFISRVIGNVAEESAVSTIEYGVDHLKTPLVVVMGHSNCGAINCVVSGNEVPDYLYSGLKQIIKLKERLLKEDPDISNKDLEHILTIENINQSLEKIIERSSIVKAGLDQGTIEIVGALYDVETGVVNWL